MGKKNRLTRSPAMQPQNKYTVTVESAEQKASIEAALKDIEKYRIAENEKADKEIASKKAEAEAKIRAEAGANTAKACQEIIAKAESEAEQIKKTAREESEKEAKSILENAKKEEEAAVQKHLEYTKKYAELAVQKTDFRNEALKDVEDEIKAITTEHKKNMDEITKYKSECEQLSRVNAQLVGDLKYYESEFGKIGEISGKLTAYEAQKEYMDNQYAALKKQFDAQREELDKQHTTILEFGEDPEQTLSRIHNLESLNNDLTQELDQYPADWERILQRSKQLDEYKEKINQLKEENLILQNQLFDLQVENTELEDYRKFVKILELQRDELKAELDRNIAQYESHTGKVFAGLSSIDNESFTKHGKKNVDLRKLCNDFRSYMNCRGSDTTSGKSSLYYSEQIVRTFIAGFASSRTMILEGLSGTGKTSLPLAFADFMGSVTDVVPVQSSWKDKNDLLGFYNDFKKQYIETDFLKKLYSAACDSNNIHIIVLDEMNLSRIEYYFADILSKLELPEGERRIILIPNAQGIAGGKDAWPKLIQDGELIIPDNVWFIGTANKDDSTFTITDKVYDRSVVIDFSSMGKRDKNLQYCSPTGISFNDFWKALTTASTWKSEEDEDKFKQALDILKSYLEPFDISFGNRIQRQLEKFVPAYIACGGEMADAIDIMFSLKVIRKLEGLYDEGTKTNLETLYSKLDKMPRSRERVDKLRKKIA